MAQATTTGRQLAPTILLEAIPTLAIQEAITTLEPILVLTTPLVPIQALDMEMTVLTTTQALTDLPIRTPRATHNLVLTDPTLRATPSLVLMDHLDKDITSHPQATMTMILTDLLTRIHLETLNLALMDHLIRTHLATLSLDRMDYLTQVLVMATTVQITVILMGLPIRILLETLSLVMDLLTRTLPVILSLLMDLPILLVTPSLVLTDLPIKEIKTLLATMITIPTALPTRTGQVLTDHPTRIPLAMTTIPTDLTKTLLETPNPVTDPPIPPVTPSLALMVRPVISRLLETMITTLMDLLTRIHLATPSLLMDHLILATSLVLMAHLEITSLLQATMTMIPMDLPTRTLLAILSLATDLLTRTPLAIMGLLILMATKTGTTRVTRRLDVMTIIIRGMEAIRTLDLMVVATLTRDPTLALMVLPDTESF